MDPHDEELIQGLLPQIPELKSAYEEHGRLKEQVDGLSQRSHLTAAEEIEKKDLQKRKLAQKDKIARLLAQHREGVSTEQSA